MDQAIKIKKIFFAMENDVAPRGCYELRAEVC